MASLVQQIIIYAIPILLAVILHEVAHGWVADRLGDPTARYSGRLTLNPAAHIDLFGTILLPLVLLISGGFIFGYAKPVPINPYNLRNPRRDIIWVSLAGIMTNLALAAVCAMVFRILASSSPGSWGFIVNPLMMMLMASVRINIILAVFNAVPIPPLDGSRVLAYLLPPAQSAVFSKLEPYGFIIILLLFFTGMINFIWPIIRFFMVLLLGPYMI
ncbi:MAG: site-2 protease family protein [Syntrophobacterales bacterium]|nr:MAG: site-2 protease family protein [Syntrophobacterales bacterium]